MFLANNYFFFCTKLLRVNLLKNKKFNLDVYKYPNTYTYKVRSATYKFNAYKSKFLNYLKKNSFNIINKSSMPNQTCSQLISLFFYKSSKPDDFQEKNNELLMTFPKL